MRILCVLFGLIGAALLMWEIDKIQQLHGGRQAWAKPSISLASKSSRVITVSPSESWREPHTGLTKAGIRRINFAPAKSQNSLHLKTFKIWDPYGWGQPVVARTLLAPADWRLQGEIRWNSNTTCTADILIENVLVSSPDGQAAFEIMPQYACFWGDNPLTQQSHRMTGCRVAPPINAANLIQQVVMPAFRRGAYVRSLAQSPETARAAYKDYYARYGALYQAQNTRLNTDTAVATLEYRREGRSFEEWLTATVALCTTPMMMGGGISYSCYGDHIYAFRAPKGQLAEYGKLFTAIAGSIHTNPVWRHAVLKVILNVNMKASIAAGTRAGIWREAMNEIGRIRVKNWQQQQETLNRVAGSWSRSFRGVDTYLDPISQQRIDLPTGYKSAWSNGRGEYMLSDNPAFDPAVQFRENWKRMRQLDR